MQEIARPYAQAAFEVAKESGNVSQWERMINWLSELVSQPLIQDFLTNPTYDPKAQTQVLIDLSSDKLNAQGQNFLRTLGENHRLLALPSIQNLFQEYMAEAEKRIDATVTSAIQLDKSYEKKLVQSLQRKLNREVECKFNVDPSLLGGLVIRAGDKVINGSLLGKLKQMHQELSNHANS